MEDVETLKQAPEMLLKNEVIMRPQRAKFLVCYSPQIKFNELWTTFCVLNDTTVYG